MKTNPMQTAKVPMRKTMMMHKRVIMLMRNLVRGSMRILKLMRQTLSRAQGKCRRWKLDIIKVIIKDEQTLNRLGP